MTKSDAWPTLEQVEAAELIDLLKWNQHLAAPAEGTPEYGILVRIVARLREAMAEAAAEEKELPHPKHPGWPMP